MLADFKDGAAVQNIMEKAYISDKRGRWKNIEQLNAPLSEAIF